MSMIEVRGLYKSFGELSVLEDVNFAAQEGECISIIGASGCGKSLLLRCLELLEIPDKGAVFIDGQEITAPKADVDRIRRSMGMVYQKFNLFAHLNVMDNLCLAPTKLLGMDRAAAEAKALNLLTQVGLSSKVSAFPKMLSGGQQQRIAICRSLMMEPKVLLLDEPTSALDPTMVGEVLAVIRMLAKRKLTMLIVTHEMKFAREVSTRVFFLAERGIYEQGTPQEIFDAPKKSLTIAFINRRKHFHYTVSGRDFDLMEMMGGIWTFGEKYAISTRELYRIQLCCEEMTYTLLERGSNIDISVSYTEATADIEFEFTWSGERFNPMTDEVLGEHELNVEIIRGTTELISFDYASGKNHLRLKLKRGGEKNFSRAAG